MGDAHSDHASSWLEALDGEGDEDDGDDEGCCCFSSRRRCCCFSSRRGCCFSTLILPAITAAAGATANAGV
ncbi:NDR1/HIN1-like protein 2 [Frankliniella fusca]|uniref:NDR1/HIN1-like protein 2 n=1 Tax=Frankliniella fusca TaxID=407009 RepID=A0AAE1HCJ7_9NEOP|nr:NDR1/HIN1-like protein 2 [Frankliniella fusca]